MNLEKIQEQVATLEQALNEAKTVIQKQRKVLDQLSSPPLVHAIVVATSGVVTPNDFIPGVQVRIRSDSEFAGQHDGVGVIRNPGSKHGWVAVDFNGRSNTYRIGLPDVDKGICDLEIADRVSTATVLFEGKCFEVLQPVRGVRPGETVALSPDTLQIVKVLKTQSHGDIGFVRRVMDKNFSEVDFQASTRVVYNGQFHNLEKGDRVVLDGTATMVVNNLGKDDERFAFTAQTNITWDEIGGLFEAKQQMIEAVELPRKNPEIFEFYGKRPARGILLYGPPGCGKTMLGKAAATAIMRIHKDEKSSSGFVYVKGPEILDRYVGSAEATIRQLFMQARKHKERMGYPAVIFIDEADAILARRDSGISSDIERTIVPMFLTEMDGMEDSGALVILATNRADILDPAVVRDGRVDRKIKITRPTVESAAEIFNIHLKQTPLSNGYSHKKLAEFGSTELFADTRKLYQIKTRTHGVYHFTLANVVNGGMIVNIVEQAKSIALHRDLASRKRNGLTKDDLVAAINTVQNQCHDTNFKEDLAEFVHDFHKDVDAIIPYKATA